MSHRSQSSVWIMSHSRGRLRETVEFWRTRGREQRTEYLDSQSQKESQAGGRNGGGGWGGSISHSLKRRKSIFMGNHISHCVSHGKERGNAQIFHASPAPSPSPFISQYPSNATLPFLYPLLSSQRSRQIKKKTDKATRPWYPITRQQDQLFPLPPGNRSGATRCGISVSCFSSPSAQSVLRLDLSLLPFDHATNENPCKLGFEQHVTLICKKPSNSP